MCNVHQRATDVDQILQAESRVATAPLPRKKDKRTKSTEARPVKTMREPRVEGRVGETCETDPTAAVRMGEKTPKVHFSKRV